MAFRDPDLAREIGVATRSALTRIVDLCLAEAVDFLVIAGDLWDGEHSSTKTPRFLKQELLRLDRAGIRCFLIRGNHDAMARQTGELEAPGNTHLFKDKAGTVTFEIEGHPVAVHGLSFREAHAPESLLPRYPRPKAGAFNLGIMHTSLNGSSGHDLYAPCSLAELEAHGFDYWALGHIHRRAVHQGQAAIVMPGTPQGRDIGEAGPATVTLVQVSDDNRVSLEIRSVAALRFERLPLDLTGLEEWSALLDQLSHALRQAGASERSEEHLVLRPVLGGETPLGWRLARDLDRLTEEARAFAADAGVHLDKLELRVTDAGGDPAQALLPADLVALIEVELPTDPALAALLAQAAREVTGHLPPELRDILGTTEAEEAAAIQRLLAEGSRATLSRLAAGKAD